MVRDDGVAALLAMRDIIPGVTASPLSLEQRAAI
jgi:hypothetical protein